MSKAETITDGLAKPSDEDLDAFWTNAKEAVPDLSDDYELLRIGGNEDTIGAILNLVKAGEKNGSFAVPWLLEAAGQDTPKVGDAKVLLAFDGTPTLVVRLTNVKPVKYGDIGPQHLTIEGPRMRDVDVWKPMHSEHWNKSLSEHGRSVTDDMPLLVTPWEVVFEA